MDAVFNPESNSNPNPQITKAPVPFPFSLTQVTIILSVAFLIGGVGGFLWSKLNSKPTPPLKITGFTLPDQKIDFPIPKELLQNPMLSLWSGHVSGKLLSKDQTSLTLTHITMDLGPKKELVFKEASDGAILKLNIDPQKTVFNLDPFANGKNPPVKEATRPAVLAFSDLKVGAILNGNVKILQKGQDWEIVGSDFFVR